MRRTLMIITVALVLCLCGCSEIPQISDMPTEPSQSESLPIKKSEGISQETDAPQSSVNIDTPEESGIASETMVPVSMFGKGDFYILRAKGDSMVDAGIDEDDLLVIERNCPALEGDIVVALDEDNQNTLKRYRGFDEDEKCFVLEYENEARYPGKVIKVQGFQVQGVARHVIKAL